jgi:hypothetical protein
MSVWYVGTSDSRTLYNGDWVDAGVVDANGDFTWDAFNGWSLSEASFSTQQIAYLLADPEFYVYAPDGPRQAISAALDGFVTRQQLYAILRSGEFGDIVGLSRASVGLDRVDNTSDVEKPISEAAQVALDKKADYPAGGTDGQVLAKLGSTTAWMPPSGNQGSVGITLVTGDSFWADGSLFNVTGSGVAQAADDLFWPSGTLYTVN